MRKLWMRWLAAAVLVSLPLALWAQITPSPKREFRGAWIQAVNGQWQGRGRDAMQAELTRELNVLQAAGINAILFQVRVEGDALYESQLEPWSRYLTGGPSRNCGSQAFLKAKKWTLHDINR